VDEIGYDCRHAIRMPAQPAVYEPGTQRSSLGVWYRSGFANGFSLGEHGHRNLSVSFFVAQNHNAMLAEERSELDRTHISITRVSARFVEA
jgi:hypothetical protein